MGTRHQQLICKYSLSPQCTVRSIGQSLEGRDIDVVTMGSGPLVVWIIARQHPGEPMAEWCSEGLLHRLTTTSSPSVQALLEQATVYVVPNMCPDGSVKGHLRTNAVGANLNREWCSKDHGSGM